MDSSNAENQTAGGEARTGRRKRPVHEEGQVAGFVERTSARNAEMQATMSAKREAWDAKLRAQELELADMQAPINKTCRPTKLSEDGRGQGGVAGAREGVAAAAREPVGQTEMGKSRWADEVASQPVAAAAGPSAAAAVDVPCGPAVKNELWKSRWAGQAVGPDAARAGGSSAAAAASAPRSSAGLGGAPRQSSENVRLLEESKREKAVTMDKKTAKGEEKTGKRHGPQYAAMLEKCYLPPAVEARKTMWETLRPMAIIGKGNGMAKVGYWEVYVDRDWSFSRTDYENMVVHTMWTYLHPLLYLYIHPPSVEGKDVPVQSLILGLKDYNAAVVHNHTWKTELNKAWGVMLDWATVMARLSSGAMDAGQWSRKRRTLYGIFTMAFEAELALSMFLAPPESTLGLFAADEQAVPISVNTPCPKGISAEIKHWTEPLWKDNLRRTILRLWAWSESPMENTSPALWRLDSRARRVFALRVLQENRNEEEEKHFLDEVVRHEREPSVPVLFGSMWMPRLYAELVDDDELGEVFGEESN